MTHPKTFEKQDGEEKIIQQGTEKRYMGKYLGGNGKKRQDQELEVAEEN